MATKKTKLTQEQKDVQELLEISKESVEEAKSNLDNTLENGIANYYNINDTAVLEFFKQLSVETTGDALGIITAYIKYVEELEGLADAEEEAFRLNVLSTKAAA